MTALVLLHEGLDVTLPLELGSSGEVRQQGGTRILAVNRADRCALEWALGIADRVIVLTVGPAESAALAGLVRARGASRGIRIWDEALPGLDAAALARVIATAVGILAPDLVLAGERGLEGATGMLPALVAARLGWPCLEDAVTVARDARGVAIERRLPGGRREEVAADCPAMLTVAAGSREPRYVSVGARRRAGVEPGETWDLARLGLARETVRRWARTRVDRVDWPRPRAKRTREVPRAQSAAERMRRLMSGRPQAETTRGSPAPERIVTGEPDQAAARLLAFLETRGFV